MICFCDCEVYQIEEAEFTRSKLLCYILENKLQNILFQVVDKNHTIIGTVQYSDILGKSCSLKDCIQKEKIFFDENVFENLRKIFNKAGTMCKFVPVYDKSEEIIYIAYEQFKEWYGYSEMLDMMYSLQVKSYFSLYALHPGLQGIFLYEMNELSFLLYKYLKKADIPYQLIGNKWIILGEKEYIREINKELMIPDFARYNIYADRRENNAIRAITQSNFFERNVELSFLDLFNEIIEENYKHALYLAADYLQTIGIKICECEVAVFLHDLKTHSEFADICCQRELHLDWIENKAYSDSDLEILYMIYGKDYVNKRLNGENENNRFIEIINGTRIFSVNQEQRRRNIYLVGPCIVNQGELMAEDTLVAHLQRYLDRKNKGLYKVNALPVFRGRAYDLEDILSTLTIGAEDIFIFISGDLKERFGIPFINLTEIFNTRSPKELWFSNIPIHVNQIGSKMVANEICEKFLDKVMGDNINDLKGTLPKIVQYPKTVSKETEEFTDKYIKRYANKIFNEGVVGAIVMNCNPFTRGHEYLIEQSLAKVDYLYIFIVEEDKSYFSFEERIKLVRENMEKYKNVIVLPSGKSILSMKTMPAYFMKETAQEVMVDASMDLSIFAIKIAPAFGISIRFVGEEPIDKITKQYNAAMEDILPRYGIAIEEIPRKELRQEVISASTVRKAIIQGDWEKIKNMVPEITYRFLKKKYKCDGEKNISKRM